MANPVAPIALAIAEGFKLLKTLQTTAQYRRMRKAIDAAEKYIQVSEKSGPFDYDMPEHKRVSRLRYYKRVFFKYNN